MGFEKLFVLKRAVQGSVEFRLAGEVGGLVGCVDGEQGRERYALRVECGVSGVVSGELDLRVGFDGGVYGG